MDLHLSLVFKKGDIVDWPEYGKILLEKCKKNEIPFHVGFELTPFCNFSCNMCYIRLNKKQAEAQGKLLTTEQWIHLAKEAKSLGALSMEVTGGEAMTRPDFHILYKTFIEMGFLIVLRTNGYAIDDRTIELLKHYKPRKVMITLYGASDRTYRKVCGIADGFTVVTKNILALKDAGLNVCLSATITRENEDDIESMQEWAGRNGFYLSLCGMLFTPIRGARRSVDHLKVRLSEDTYALSEGMKSLPREIPDRDFYMNPFWMCRAYGAKLTITWDGKMTMCNSNPSIWKDPFSEGMGKAYHELYSELRKIRRPKECGDCKYIDLCSVCPSMLYSATGSMERTTYEMCRIAHRKYKNQLLMTGYKAESDDQIQDNPCDEGV